MIKLQAIPNMPQIKECDNIAEIIVKSLMENNITLQDKSILCVASKIISIAEERVCDLKDVKVSDIANKIHEKIPRKNAKVIQKIIDVTEQYDGDKVEVVDNYIGAWLPNGLKLTSGGVDKYGIDKVILLPKNADLSAKVISEYIQKRLNKKVAVVITDSDGRIDKMGATQIAVGIYGIHPLRNLKVENKVTSETLCDMLAASAGLIMGQRGVNKPVVLIEGIDYDFSEQVSIKDAIAQT